MIVVEEVVAGSQLILSLTVRNRAGALVAPASIGLTVTPPNGIAASYTPSAVSTGYYEQVLDTDIANAVGEWSYQWATINPKLKSRVGYFKCI